MSDKAFIDTNVLVYLFDGRTPAKQRRAADLLQRLVDEGGTPVVSTQVLQETFVALTRKLDMDPQEALGTLQMMNDASFLVQPIDVPMVWRAAERSNEHKISFWDALIIETARASGCTHLYSEDLQAGRSFQNLTVVNPFA